VLNFLPETLAFSAQTVPSVLQSASETIEFPGTGAEKGDSD
jgi:hypothetical protein